MYSSNYEDPEYDLNPKNDLILFGGAFKSER